MPEEKTDAGPKKKTDAGPKKKTDAGPNNKQTMETRKPGKRTAVAHRDQFPIVGIGASAGGLEAFEQFFTNMPEDPGMAFVVVQHLDPTHKSILSELLNRFTKMRVVQVEDGMTVDKNTVFVIPPNRNLAILHGHLHLLEATRTPGLRTPIDFFFRSLAEDQKEKAICIVLSGTGTEGALGLRAVKGEGGMGMVQEPTSARYDGMPRNAINTGLADYILPPDKMPGQLITYVGHALKPSEQVAAPPVKDSDLLAKVFILVRSQTSHDFSFYKQNTILRRIDRRMAVHQITKLADYVRYLQEDPRETMTLFKDLLIGVTNFFRDKEAFDVLRSKVLPQMFQGKTREQPVRIWVPGCATGEEAYTIAMVCRNVMHDMGKEVPVQIFATDIDNDAIETARTGLYPNSIAVDLVSTDIDKFFSREDSFFRVKKDIRDMVVFALQNLITDPPFSKIDLISCRNILIYLNAAVQKKILPLFHYSLKKGGFLLLGSSESIGEFTDYFLPVDRKWKVFSRRDLAEKDKGVVEIPLTVMTDRKARGPGKTELKLGGPRSSYRQVAEKELLDSYAPTLVIINEKNEILYILGKAGKYLEPATGEFTDNIVAMAREGLRIELTTSIRKAIAQKKEVRADGLKVNTNGGQQIVNLVVRPIMEPVEMHGLLMVIFENVASSQTAEPESRPDLNHAGEQDPRVVELERELRATREYLKTTIEELETSNEELKSTNEELQSSNEELQSTNEELETSKEELQSVNEELTTVNAEHQQKIEQLSKISSDLHNLLSSTEIGTIFLDDQLNIRRFTPAATDFLNLMPSDIGRPIGHLASNMDYANLNDDANNVLKKLIPKELEVETNNHRNYIMRILPYRTVENVIDGVVVTFVEITERKKHEQELFESRLHVARDLEAMTGLLQEALELSVGQSSIENVLEKVLYAGIVITRADMGNIQLFHRESGTLRIAVHKGFHQPWLDYWNEVHPGQGTCGPVMALKERVIVEDVTQSPVFVGTEALKIQLTAGVRAVYSTPLIDRSGNFRGVLSTHFKSPHRPSEEVVRIVDLLARQASEIIERYGG